jgi:hypothetical protein
MFPFGKIQDKDYLKYSRVGHENMSRFLKYEELWVGNITNIDRVMHATTFKLSHNYTYISGMFISIYNMSDR